jgi:alkylation response protein AidB-like acyl-CoA dehydrogenase
VNFELTDEQQGLQNAAIEFARSLPDADLIRRDREEYFNGEAWQRCADFGLLGMPIPESHGGQGRGLTELIAAMEGMGYGTRDQGLLFSINAHLWTNSIPILRYGTADQQRAYLPRLCNGELIGAHAATEPDAGSDVFAMRTRAVRRDDHYVLTGDKTFVSNAQIAGLFAVYATIDPALGPMGITAFLVERDAPGLIVGRNLEKMGLRTSPMAEVTLDECAVPVTQRLGREGRGAEVFECAMEWERGCILANYLGVMRHQLESCVRHARTRSQFGMAIGKFQSVANRIVDLRVRLDTCRPLVYRIGWLKDHNRPARVESAIAKLYVSEALIETSLHAVQILGGNGYMVEFGAERDLRNAIGSTIYSGTSEMQRNIIAKGLGL